MESRFEEALGADPEFAPESESELDSLEGVEAAALARTLAGARARDAAAGRTLSGPHLSDLEAVYAAKDMPAAACSTGEQKALLVALALANARALADTTGAAPVLLMDEVAAHLDAERRRALFAEIEALGAQAWMTGTSADLFEGVGPGTLRLAVSEEGGRSALAGA